MKTYIVKAKINLEVEADNEEAAKEQAAEELSDFLRYHSITELMGVQRKS
jgi:hypothetical protein